MSLQFIFVGGARTGWARPVEREYCRRLAPWRARIITVKKGAGPAATAEEAKRIEKALAPGALLVAVDERGRRFSSVAFARQLGRWRQAPAVAFIVGGAAGLDARLLDAADARLALSAMTLAHDVARVLLLEQCYRAWTLASGHPYHRG